MAPLADAKAIENAAAGRISSNLPMADLHLNFPLSTFNFQLDKPLSNALPHHDTICQHSEQLPLF
ncbi:hypothetical protein [Eubacterium limosum]|uniref:hypothetical protein n=1 Tax=Eubacterium limosum TaxID=1736 RepID=UPI0010637AB3|nr:hypothetical protein [Eubacterium limosum]